MSNQLLTPLQGTLHQALTFEQIDLSDRSFNTKSVTRAKFLQFLGDQLDSNPNVHSYYFYRKGTHASVIVTYVDKYTFSLGFKLESPGYYDYNTNAFERRTFRDYIALVLSAPCTPLRIDFSYTKSFQMYY